MTDQERLGAVCWLLTAQFFVVQAAAQALMPGYDLALYDISVLGVTECGVYMDATSGNPDVLCSPLHWLFNFGIMLHGLLGLMGIWLTRELWPAKIWIDLAMWCLAIGCLGAIIVGFYPINIALSPHVFGAILALALPGFGLLLLGWGLQSERTVFAGISYALGLCILIGALGHAMGGPLLGRGTVERMAAWPQTVFYMFAGTMMLVRSSRKAQAKPALLSRPA